MQSAPRMQLYGGPDEIRKVVSAVAAKLQQEAGVLSHIVRVVKGTSGKASRVVSEESQKSEHNVSDTVDRALVKSREPEPDQGQGKPDLLTDLPTDPIVGCTLAGGLAGYTDGTGWGGACRCRGLGCKRY